MSIDIKILKEVHTLNRSVHQNAIEYFHSRPIVTSKSSIILPSNSRHTFNFEYDLKDVLFIGAITESPVLMTGGTDLGKTALAKLMMNGLFGKEEEGWHRLDFDLDFGKDAYTDVKSDFFHESGKTLDDLYSLQSWMKLPGFIADELNGVHPKVARKALHIIQEKDITLANGKRAKIGISTEDGKTYQFQIATINEGKDYQGTFDMDKALRRRTTIEIPMDNFMPTPYDRMMIKKRGKKEIPLQNNANNISMVLEIYKQIEANLNLHPTAEMFLAYMEAFDYCKHSLTGEKGSIDSRNGSVRHVCTQPAKLGGQGVGDMSCEFLRTFENELCPYVKGITPGVSKNLISVAKGFSVLRATKFAEMMAGYIEGVEERPLSYSINFFGKFTDSLKEYTKTSLEGEDLAKAAVEKYFGSLEVERQDIQSAAGFVGFSKVGISAPWVSKHFQGDKYAAITNFAKEAITKFEEALADPVMENLGEILQGKGTDAEIESIKSYCDRRNPWVWRVISPYLRTDVNQMAAEKINKLYG